jgi:carotenoid cleavage dioxygenase
MAACFASDNPLLSGAFEPIRFECDYADLLVDGDWPADLEGVLYRIGPNPQFAPRGVYNPLQGDGMVHAFRMAGGRVAYRNRWVRTRQWSLERQSGRALFSTSDPRDNDPLVAGEVSQGAANTHIVAHAGRLLALEEGHPPIEIAPQSLQTLGPFDFAGRLPGNMTAHPKTDPQTGEMIFFANFPNRRFDGALALHVADAAGRIVRTEAIAGPYPALVHDFAITQTHIVFIVCPVTLSLERLRAGGAPIAWEADREVFVGVMPRTGGDTAWFAAPTCMVWHTLNAYDYGGRIHLDVCQQAAAAFPAPDGRLAPEPLLRQHLARWTIDPGSSQPVIVHRLSEIVCDYPRIDERRTGLPYRYGFVAAEGGPGTGDYQHRAIGRFDHVTAEMSLWRPPPGHAVSEPVFAPKPGVDDEGPGYLLVVVFDEGRNRSHLAVLNAERVQDGPIACAWLDHRVPGGFHGSFVAN